MLFSHRQGVLYVEHCRIVASDGQVSFVRAVDALEKHWSIPHANVCVLLCGPGTSITHQAAHRLSEEGVMLGFVSGGGTPLFFASQSEYRPTEFCQQWVSRWQSQEWRLAVARHFAKARCKQVLHCYKKEGLLVEEVEETVANFESMLATSSSVSVLLGHEATFAKSLYAYHRKRWGAKEFARIPQGEDLVNKYIDAGNYMAYGLAASVLWVLGVPHAFPVTHGMTRRGALVFDLADTIKDAMLLPVAFDCGYEKTKEQMHRARCLAMLDKHNALVFLFDTMKEAIGQFTEEW